MTHPMATAHTPDPSIQVNQQAEMDAGWRSAQVVGGCNACSDRTSPVVCEVSLRAMKIRLCPTCRSNLIGLFSSMGKPTAAHSIW